VAKACKITSFIYLAATVDRHNRQAAAWDVSIRWKGTCACKCSTRACVPLHPEAFTTDQGSSSQSGVHRTAEGRGRRDPHGRLRCWRDNVLVERPAQRKYEEVYLRAYETVSQARDGIVVSDSCSTADGAIAMPDFQLLA